VKTVEMGNRGEEWGGKQMEEGEKQETEI